MALSQETSRAADYLRNIFECGKTLKLSGPQRLSNGNSYSFVVSAYGKEMDFCLTREQLDDVPGTKEYRDEANALARALEFRFRNCDPNLFVTSSGRVLHISPDWPAMPLLNPGGTGYIAASGTRVLLKDRLSEEVAICLVKITHMQSLPGPQSTPFHRLAAITNSIRADVDAGKIVFHPTFEQHPKIMQNVDFRYDAKAPEGISVAHYLQQKVWLLGFRCGRKDSAVWVTDPWDATYLGCPTASLHQEASILDARETIQLDESGDFASAGRSLLSQGGPSNTHSEPATTSDLADREFDVFISHSTVDDYRTTREERFVNTTRQVQAAAGLLVVGLQQRLLSSIEAFARSLKVHRATVERQWEKTRNGTVKVASESARDEALFVSVPDADDERSQWTAEELEADETTEIEDVTAAAEAESPQDATALSLWHHEKSLLDQMQAIAEKARYQPDAKVRKLIDWIRENQCADLPPFGKRLSGPTAKWNNRRVLIFTENREGTKRFLKTILEEAIESTDRADERIEVIDGLTSSTRRKEIQRRFNTDPEKDPLRILLATDAAREGLNFQAHCIDLFHFDLPWNPGRIEQRNGRIDRKLQPAGEVYCHYFVLPQRVEDRVLDVLVRKTETIRRELGSLSKVIDGEIERRLGQGIRHRDAERLALEIEKADLDPSRKRISEEELEAARGRQEDLKEQIERCQGLLQASRVWTGFEPAPFRDALSCSLQLLGVEGLKETIDDAGRPVWVFPRLDRRAETDASWAATLDTLRSPRKQDQKLAEWRREAPIRPVIFEDAGVLTEDTVHLHLEQRVAQRLLSRFRSQGFIHHDLSRACLAQASDSIPRVILLGRLSLYGQGAERLHEQIVPITARWIEPSQRKAALTAFAAEREAETKTLDLLERSLSGQNLHEPGDAVRRKLLDSAPRDIQELLPQLEPRADELAAIAIEKLAQRGTREEKDLRETLEQQRERVRAELAKTEGQPLSEHPDEVYRALLTVILRLVFLLFAEEKDMLPEDETFLRYYSLAGLFERLREDAALFPDTMDQRYGAWAQILVLFRMIYDGAESGAMRLPKRHGVLFDPDRFPFLEGRFFSATLRPGERIEPPLVPDGTIYRALEKLLVLDGEHISYRALDVEQIGSVYETMMGFRLEMATGRSIAVKADKKQGAPTAVNLELLIAEPPAKREKWLQDHADRKISDTVKKSVQAATSLEDLHAALLPVVDLAASPDLVSEGAMVLQPSEERRRSGSHYTPRELTNPIVRTTLEPILARLRDGTGRPPRPEQILDLKVCDPAMGSGAFLVETCRQLGDALVESWHSHNELTVIPADEDESVFARQTIAQRCLYGVDKNPVAVDLAKMSLWLVTLAKDHALTFVDHALRCGDSLIGLSRKQIAAFHWNPSPQMGLIEERIRKTIDTVSNYRKQILSARDDVPYSLLRQRLDLAEEALNLPRQIGDAVIAAYFSAEKAKDRENARVALSDQLIEDLRRQDFIKLDGEIDVAIATLKRGSKGLQPFHWEIEFPEVFHRENTGFDAIVGNPPFSGVVQLAKALGDSFPEFLRTYWSGVASTFSAARRDTRSNISGPTTRNCTPTSLCTRMTFRNIGTASAACCFCRRALTQVMVICPTKKNCPTTLNRTCLLGA